MITLDSTVAASQDTVSADLGDETVVLDLKRGVYYRFVPLAARVWELIQEPRSVREVRDTLLAGYTAEARRCEGALVTLLKQLVKKALIDVFNAP